MIDTTMMQALLCCRPAGRCCRRPWALKPFAWAGDEFVHLLGSPELRMVEAYISALHAGVRGLREQYGIALNIGVTRFDPGSVPNPDTAFK